MSTNQQLTQENGDSLIEKIRRGIEAFDTRLQGTKQGKKLIGIGHIEEVLGGNINKYIEHFRRELLRLPDDEAKRVMDSFRKDLQYHLIMGDGCAFDLWKKLELPVVFLTRAFMFLDRRHTIMTTPYAKHTARMDENTSLQLLELLSSLPITVAKGFMESMNTKVLYLLCASEIQNFLCIDNTKPNLLRNSDELRNELLYRRDTQVSLYEVRQEQNLESWDMSPSQISELTWCIKTGVLLPEDEMPLSRWLQEYCPSVFGAVMHDIYFGGFDEWRLEFYELQKRNTAFGQKQLFKDQDKAFASISEQVEEEDLRLIEELIPDLSSK